MSSAIEILVSAIVISMVLVFQAFTKHCLIEKKTHFTSDILKSFFKVISCHNMCFDKT